MAGQARERERAVMNLPAVNSSTRFSDQTAPWQIELDLSESHAEWDSFVAATSAGNHLQTSHWGAVKATIGWHSLRLTAVQDGTILAGAQLLIRKIAPGIAVCYITRGPLLRPGCDSLASPFIHEILMLGRKQRITFLAIQPPIHGDSLVSGLLHNGFECSTLELAPTASILIDLHQDEDQLLNNMKRQTRQNVRRSARDGIITRVGEEKDLPVFYQLHQQTSHRQNFFPYTQAYINKMWTEFSPSQNIGLILTEFNNEPVSGLLLIAFGEIVCAKLLGWSGAYAEHRPNDALFWAAVQWAKANGYRYFDFEGIEREAALAVLQGGELPEKFHHSPDFLKLGFGGQVTIFPEAYEYSYNPLVRSITRKLEMKVGAQSWTSKMIDRIRKR